MSRASRIKLVVVGCVGLVPTIFYCAEHFNAGSLQAVVAGVGVIVLAALGIQSQNQNPPPEDKPK